MKKQTKKEINLIKKIIDVLIKSNNDYIKTDHVLDILNAWKAQMEGKHD